MAKRAGALNCLDHASNPIRRVEVLAFPRAQLLDVTGPVQVFASANDLAVEAGGAPHYTFSIVARGGESIRYRFRWLGTDGEPAFLRRRAVGHADCRRRPGRRGRGGRSGPDRVAAPTSQERAPRRLRLHRRISSRRGRTPRRKTRSDALVVLRRSGQAFPRPHEWRPNFDLCARWPDLDIGRRNGGHRSRAGPGRAGPWSQCGVGGGAVSRRLSETSGRPGAVQRGAFLAGGRRQIRRVA